MASIESFWDSIMLHVPGSSRIVESHDSGLGTCVVTCTDDQSLNPAPTPESVIPSIGFLLFSGNAGLSYVSTIARMWHYRSEK